MLTYVRYEPPYLLVNSLVFFFAVSSCWAFSWSHHPSFQSRRSCLRPCWKSVLPSASNRMPLRTSSMPCSVRTYATFTEKDSNWQLIPQTMLEWHISSDFCITVSLCGYLHCVFSVWQHCLVFLRTSKGIWRRLGIYWMRTKEKKRKWRSRWFLYDSVVSTKILLIVLQ